MKKISFTRISAVFLLFVGSSTLNVQAQMSAKKIDQLVENTMKTFDVPGIAVAVVKDGKVIHSKGYGVRSLNTKQKVDENTLFGIASNSKAFATASIAMLVDEKKLKWDDKVTDYIPEFRMYNPYVTEEFTIRDLVTHRSGLGLGAGDLMAFPDSNSYTMPEIIHNLRYLKPVSGFRTKYDYDNLLYMTAGEVVAKVSGMSWAAFVEERMMKPLQMTQSAATYKRLKDKSNVIDPHAPVKGKVQVVDRFNSEIGPAAWGLYSNLIDMNKWVLMQLNKGKFGEGQKNRLFSEAQQNEMWSPQTLLPLSSYNPYNSHFLAYGLGWFVTDVKGTKQVSHTGGMPGMVTQVTLLPDMNLGIIVLTNQQSGSAFTAITNQIKDSYLGIKNTDRVKEYNERRLAGEAHAAKVVAKVENEIKEQQAKKAATIEPSAIVGTYKDNWFGEVEIFEKHGKTWFKSQRSPKLIGEMLPYKANTYIVKWRDRSQDADAFVMFSLDNDGKATSIKMKPISPLTDFSFDFQDLDLYRIKDAAASL
ncbi:serine hydrolase [Adhaeribacter soli]|uniref:Serine hydrolase n=1 Tax=Adhaeribacter soli TaxID=2607655 RepID=A0A5N1J4X3_9BACT|nr:serine hydrolase [Adhaeribacter soli]KAA9345961.1 serine hydrolase [Adhaeribacter soli]